MFFILLAATTLIPIILIAIALRRVVPTNEVHIVQSGRSTTSYGKDTGNGNSYYEWPSWVPLIGITVTSFPTSVFDVDLEDYEAFDKGRLPFAVDVKAFFRVMDSNMAAQRVSSFEELKNQLTAVVQGAVRVVLGTHDIEEIMQGRSGLGESFTREVNEQLAQWGVTTVKSIELMDLRDGQNGQAIHNIMEKKKSHILSESRIEVAKNNRAAEVAEVQAKQEVDLRKQEAAQLVGLRTAEQEREVAIAKEKAQQAMKEQAKVTKEKEMEVQRVQAVKTAEINRDAAVVKAEQERQQMVIAAEAKLEQQRRDAEGTQAQGEAKAAAEKAMQLAPVQAQITLAEKIASLDGYQNYLTTIRKIEAVQAVGIENARALEKADVKVIANTGSAADGISSVGELFSSKGGLGIGAMLEGLANTDTGKAMLKTVGVKVPEDKVVQ